MNVSRQKILPIEIEDEMQRSYIDYSMSVIIGRALPDVRDGLKPVQRRILYSMNELGLAYNRPYKKSARIVGDVLGKYHPHGDSAVYDTMVRLVQPFSQRYPLLNGQGNYGSVDGDPAAAMRYTECRMGQLAGEMLRDIEKETVEYAPNFDESLTEPTVMPGALPNLLVNGCSGIAVGMSTNIPPHNLGEIVDALTALIDDPELTVDGLLPYVSGPDFPTGGVIYGRESIREAYRNGRGLIIVRGQASIERHKNDRVTIVITEIPYMVNKSGLIEKIAKMVQQKKVEGVRDLRDESDRDGMRIVLELKRDAYPDVVLNQLYKHTQMQVTFGAIMLALVDNRPKLLNLKQLLTHFLDHRHEMVVRRTTFELRKAEERAHILEGLKICLDHLDEVIALIRKAPDPDTARKNLMKSFKMTEIQAQAILDMRLQRLTQLERDKIENEYLEIIKTISRLKGILESRERRMGIIKEELAELKAKYGDERRTDIIEATGELSMEDIIAEEEMVITISHGGYIKRLPIGTYRRQWRGGRGVSGGATKEDDFMEHLFIGSTHHYILFFTNLGRCYWLKVFEVPQEGRLARGKYIANLLQLQSDEKIAAFVPVKEFAPDQFLMMSTAKGLVKKTPLTAYSHPRRGGIMAIDIPEGDNLIEAKLTDGSCDIILATESGLAIRFNEREVRPMGRVSRGVRGVRLAQNDQTIGMVIVKRSASLLAVTENGFGKRTSIDSYRVTHRGGKGIINIKTSERNGKVISIKEVVESDELMIITHKGIVIKMPVQNISEIGRNTQGVRLQNLDEDDKVVDVARVIPTDEELDKDEEANGEVNNEAANGETAVQDD
jgi:DNA gyrase subunit A